MIFSIFSFSLKQKLLCCSFLHQKGRPSFFLKEKRGEIFFLKQSLFSKNKSIFMVFQPVMKNIFGKNKTKALPATALKYNNVITFKPFSNNVVITPNIYLSFLKHIYNVITYTKICYYIVILLSLFIPIKGYAVSLKQPITQGTLIYGHAQKGEQVFLQDSELKQDKEGYFVFALPQDTEETLFLTTQQDGKTKTYSAPIEKRSWTEEIVNGLPPQKVSPSPENQKRITMENELVAQGRKETLYETLPFCFIRPVSSRARISSTFGSRRILNGTKTMEHSGTDYALPVGSPVVSPADGVVKVAYDEMFLSGKTILIDHGFGLYTSYSHLDKLNVYPNQLVKQGDKIGEVGMTGRSTGPHLHLVLSWFNTRVDPEFIFQKYGCAK